VSVTVEILFRTHTDATRGVANALIPQGIVALPGTREQPNFYHAGGSPCL